MRLDPSFVGRTYPPTAPYLVGREKIREFARAIGATDPAEAEFRGVSLERKRLANALDKLPDR